MERVEVITSIERKRRFSDQQKFAILAEAKRTTVAHAAAKYEISPSVIYTWKHKIKDGCHAVAKTVPAFVKVAPEPPKPEVSEQPIYVHLGEVVVEFPTSVDMKSLLSFIQTLRG